MNVFNEKIIDNAVMDENITSDAIPLVNMVGFCIQAVYTGTPTGTLKLQASADAFKYANASQPQAPTNWTDVGDSSESITAAGSTMWSVDAVYYNFVRLVYTDTSGGLSTAVLNVRINAKGV
jgi:hypothetical protein